MASISSARGNRRILFVDPISGKRKTIYLGKTPIKAATTIKVHVENLVASLASNSLPDPITGEWLNGAGEDIHRKLAAVGLVSARGSGTLGAFVDEYITGRTDIKDRTRTNLETTKLYLVRFFGEAKPLREVTEADAKSFVVWMKTEEYANATIGREIKRARQLWTAAMERKLVASNPFMAIKKLPKMVNTTRAFFITREMASAVLDACPDAQWRLIFALSRFGGLRCPSEHAKLRWEDVDWANNRIRIRSPKKADDEHGGERVIPIFPEIRGPLTEVWEAAEEGEPMVLTKHIDAGHNLGVRLHRIIRLAGLTPWPKLFQNLRASRETELTAEYPLHVVCRWIGNSAAVATAHYLQVTDAHFATAAGNASGNAPDDARRERTTRQTTQPVPAPSRQEDAGDAENADQDPVLSACVDSGRIQAVLPMPPGRGLFFMAINS